MRRREHGLSILLRGEDCARVRDRVDRRRLRALLRDPLDDCCAAAGQHEPRADLGLARGGERAINVERVVARERQPARCRLERDHRRRRLRLGVLVDEDPRERNGSVARGGHDAVARRKLGHAHELGSGACALVAGAVGGRRRRGSVDEAAGHRRVLCKAARPRVGGAHEEARSDSAAAALVAQERAVVIVAVRRPASRIRRVHPAAAILGELRVVDAAAAYSRLQAANVELGHVLDGMLAARVSQIRCERRRERRHQSDEADEEGRRHQGETQGSASASLRTPTRVSSERVASLAKEGSFRSTRLHSLPFHPHIR